MRGEIEAIRASKRKAKAQRDNWKARYVALEAALRDDVYADQFPFVGQYRARLLALIDAAKETP